MADSKLNELSLITTPTMNSPLYTVESNSDKRMLVKNISQVIGNENIAPAYDPTETYSEGDLRMREGKLYQANQDIDTPEQFDATKWDEIKVTELLSGGASVVQLTQAEYTALSTAEKMNGSIYKLTDKAIFYCLDEEYHAVKELTTAQYEALTSAQQNNGTIYIKTDAVTTAADIPYDNTESVADKIDELEPNITTQTVDGVSWTIKRNGKFYEMWADISIDASAVTPVQWGSLYVYRNSKTTYLLPVTLAKKVCDFSYSSGATATMTVYYTDLSSQENEKTSADAIRATQTTSTIVVHKYIRGYVN